MDEWFEADSCSPSGDQPMGEQGMKIRGVYWYCLNNGTQRACCVAGISRAVLSRRTLWPVRVRRFFFGRNMLDFIMFLTFSWWKIVVYKSGQYIQEMIPVKALCAGVDLLKILLLLRGRVTIRSINPQRACLNSSHSSRNKTYVHVFIDLHVWSF